MQDYDYAYDYSEFTIKPQNRTTVKPLNGMSTSTQRIQPTLNNSVPTIAVEEITTPSYAEEFTASTSSENITTITNTTIKTPETNLTQFIETSTHIVPSLNTTAKNCKRGFVLNQRGNCQLKLNSTGNA